MSDEPRPLTADEPTEIADSLELEGAAKAGDVDAQLTLRLVAEVRRLRRLVRGADKLLTPGVASSLSQAQVEQIYNAIKAEAERG